MTTPGKSGRRRWRWMAGALAVAVFGAVAVVVVMTRERVEPPDLNAVRGALAQQRWPEVEARLGRWHDAHPDDGDSGVMLGLARLGAGRLDDGIAVLLRIPETHPAWGQAQSLLGEAQIHRHHAAEAERRFRRALERDPRAAPPRQRLIYLLGLQQRHGEARDQLWELFGQARDPRMLLDLVDRLWAHEDDVRGLSPDLEAFWRATPDDPFLCRAWGLALLYQGRASEALPLLETAARGLTDDPGGRFALAECRLGLGRFDGDLGVLGPRPGPPADAARWLVLRGRLEEALGRPGDALASLRAAVAASPDDREAHFRLGHLLARSGVAVEARTHLDRAQAIAERRNAARREHDRVRRDGFSADPDLYERLGLACRAAGLNAEARAWFDLALRLDPARTSARDSLARTPEATLQFFARPRRAEAEVPRAAAIVSVEDAGGVVRFEDVTSRSGLSYRYDSGASDRHFLADTIGGGVGLIDFDGDGFLDVYFVNGCPLPFDTSRPPAQNRLYRNRGDGTFEDVTDRAGVGGRGFGMGCAAGDYDGDGHDDLFITGVGATVLYRNRGDGTFEDVTDRAGVASDRWTTAAAFADLDGDGDLDLIVAGYVEEDLSRPRGCRDATGRPIHCSPKSYPAQPDHLFRNNGDGTFTDVASEAGFEAPEGRGLGLAVADFDGDGRLDVYVANDATEDFLFRNLGGLRFEEVGLVAGVALDGEGRATASMGTVADDLDGDGLIDLLHTNLLNEGSTLHRNVGGGLFRDATLESGLYAPSRSRTGFGVAALDADNDGRFDLFVANGHVDDQPWIHSPMAQAPQLFLGREGGRFAPAGVDAFSYLGRSVVGRGLAAGDLDNDGRVDVVVVHRDAPAVLLRNVTPGGHWLGLGLRGRSAGPAPVGSRVTCRAGGRTTVRWVTAGTGYLGPNDPRMYFGLGPADRVERLDVSWPSGLSQTWTDLPADNLLTLSEGGEPSTSPAPPPVLQGSPRQSLQIRRAPP